MVDLLTGGLGAIFAMFMAFLIIALIVGVALYIYGALAWSTIARKLKYERPWLAWIPFANGCQILQLGEFHWAWIFLILIPFLGWAVLGVMLIIAQWRIYEKRKYPGWLALIPLLSVIPLVGGLAGIASLVILGFVAWKDR